MGYILNARLVAGVGGRQTIGGNIIITIKTE